MKVQNNITTGKMQLYFKIIITIIILNFTVKYYNSNNSFPITDGKNSYIKRL